MKTELSQEDRRILKILDRLNRDGEAALEEAKLVREHAELLALLPYDLEPVAPRAEVWRRIQAEITADETVPFEAESVVPISSHGAMTATSSRDARSHDGSTLVPFPNRSGLSAENLPEPQTPLPVSVSRPAIWGTYAMAATLAVCLLGVGYLLAMTQHQRSTIDELRGDMTVAESRQLDLRQVEDQYLMVTRTARQYYPMRPVSLSPEQDPVFGRVWVCGRHQQWLLNVEGIHPAPAGYEYRFWFETRAGKVVGGAVQVEDGVGKLAAASMPVGTTGFSVTLEPLNGKARGGESQELLRGEEAQILLGIEDLVLDPPDLSM